MIVPAAMRQCEPIVIALPTVNWQPWPMPVLSPIVKVGRSTKRAANLNTHFPSTVTLLPTIILPLPWTQCRYVPVWKFFP